MEKRVYIGLTLHGKLRVLRKYFALQEFVFMLFTISPQHNVEYRTETIYFALLGK